MRLRGGKLCLLRKLFRRRSVFCRRRAPTADAFHAVVTTGLRGKSAATDPAVTTESTSCGRTFPQSPAARPTQTQGVPGVAKLVHNPVARGTVALGLALFGICATSRGEEPISFVLPAANFQPVAADAYPAEIAPPQPPIPDELLTPPPTEPTPDSLVSPESSVDVEPLPPQLFESGGCESCNSNGGCAPERLPNGQIPDDWMWGCGGWPYANGPGMCDDWKVGCRWHVETDGMILFRQDANLDALLDATNAGQDEPEVFDQFNYAPGGRVFLSSEIPHRAGYQIEAGYEGVEEWNASIVYPLIPPVPVGPDFASEQTSVSYRSSLHSGELNFIRRYSSYCRCFCGVRYVKFDDEINVTTNEAVAPPLPVLAPPPDITTETDRVHILDLQNNLIGFQMGSRFDVWHPVDRLTLEGFVNAGVYYNHIQRASLVSDTTTQFTGDDTSTALVDESRVDVSTATNLDISEPSEVATIGEASLTSVYRLNRCWALRAGYQVLWIDGVSLAQDGLLDTGVKTRDLLFHGCHFGIECRR